MIKFIKKQIRKIGIDIVKVNSKSLSNRDLFEHDIKVIVKKKDPVIFDVGANKGQSIRTYQSLFKEAKIYSFEPNSELFSELRKKFEKDPQVKLFSDALGEKTGTDEFIIYQNNELSSFKYLEDISANPFAKEKIASKIQTKVNTLDNFVERNDIENIDLLKIDTQGYELEILNGATKVLQNGVVKNIYLELNLISMYNNQSDYIDILQLLKKHNFKMVGLYELNRPQNYIRWANALFIKINE